MSAHVQDSPVVSLYFNSSLIEFVNVELMDMEDQLDSEEGPL